MVPDISPDTTVALHAITDIDVISGFTTVLYGGSDNPFQVDSGE